MRTNRNSNSSRWISRCCRRGRDGMTWRNNLTTEDRSLTTKDTKEHKGRQKRAGVKFIHAEFIEAEEFHTFLEPLRGSSCTLWLQVLWLSDGTTQLITEVLPQRRGLVPDHRRHSGLGGGEAP